MRMPLTSQESIMTLLKDTSDTLDLTRDSVAQQWNTEVVQVGVAAVLEDLSEVVRRLGHRGEAQRIEKESQALLREETHYIPNRGVVDEDGAQELYLYLTNTSELYGPNSMGEAIERRYATLWQRGQFVEEKAITGYQPLVATSAKSYVREHGSPGTVWHEMFNAPTRTVVARQLVDDFVSEARLGNFRR